MPDTYSDIFAGHFTGKKVVVIGAARGIGKAVAAAFAGAGADVLITDVNDTVGATADELSSAGLSVRSITSDVVRVEDLREVFQQVTDTWGKLDVLINNAGIISIKRLSDTTTEEFNRVLEVNTTGQFTAIREAYPLLKSAGGGVVLNAASGQARQGFIYTPSYAASKFGVMGLTQSLAKELAPDNIRVNAYCPGIVATEMWEYNDREWGRLIGGYEPGEYIAQAIKSIPLGRAATEADVANALLFLASDAASYITGQALNIDGGMFMN